MPTAPSTAYVRYSFTFTHGGRSLRHDYQPSTDFPHSTLFAVRRSYTARLVYAATPVKRTARYLRVRAPCRV